jgi:hypothetical protein
VALMAGDERLTLPDSTLEIANGHTGKVAFMLPPRKQCVLQIIPES